MRGPASARTADAPAADPQATVSGLFQATCDPLVLAVTTTRPWPALTAAVDWRLAGRLSRGVRALGAPLSGPLLIPGSPQLPPARLLLVPVGALELAALAASCAELGGARAGLCPEEFGWTPAEVRVAFGPGRVVIFSPAAEASK